MLTATRAGLVKRITERLARLEESRNGSPAHVWLLDLLEELEAAKREGREAAPRKPNIDENTEVVTMLNRYGIAPVIDTGEHEW
jgi:hypothetical protein